MSFIHQDLARGRWFTFTLAQQLGNAGSEYERACRAKLQSDTDRFDQATARLLELIDLTIADPRWRNHRLKELCRLREQICEELVGVNQNQLGSFKNYFLNFSLLARAGT